MRDDSVESNLKLRALRKEFVELHEEIRKIRSEIERKSGWKDTGDLFNLLLERLNRASEVIKEHKFITARFIQKIKSDS